MAQWRKHDSNIDPFNAGEPVMPWDDPSSFEDRSYEEPRPRSKRRDDYDAPSPIEEEPLAGLDVDGETPASEATAPERPSRRREKRPRPARSARASDPSAKVNPRANQAGAPRGCARFVRLFIIVTMLATFLPAFVACMADVVIPGFDRDDPGTGDVPAYDDSTPNYSDTELACIHAVEARIATLEDDPVMHGAIIEGLDTRLQANFGHTSAELGIDGEAFASWVTAHVSYEVSSVYTYDNGEATVYLDTLSPSAYTVAYDLIDDISAYFDENGIPFDGSAALTDAQRADIAAIYENVISSADAENPSFLRISLNLDEDGVTWVVDEDFFIDQMGIGLGV